MDLSPPRAGRAGALVVRALGAAVAAQILGCARAILDAPRKVPSLPPREWPSVEIVVVGYNSRRIIAPTLRSFLAQDYPSATVTLVDNASQDGTAQFVREEFPSIRVLESKDNLGFAGQCPAPIPSTGTPASFTVFTGLPFAGEFSLQGVMFISGAAGGVNLAVTNAVKVVVGP